ncbi:lipid-binding SYLF domain-containing protein [Noviherbaspirillum pedocola]|uniref:Lipid-binding SYLF domain-containing protein n=1 Tax=Noviherbaspirillum pedocola TaxID=2801341 RepID=A0A934T2H7_9BURK|nr:lipid-binding SYLF domain-containing protein [Noviherbaspirillum pedocola]MBK4736763.1 lipid-binding SYLF domain-containing protein [Noviherbaspirillum pedocola]
MLNKKMRSGFAVVPLALSLSVVPIAFTVLGGCASPQSSGDAQQTMREAETTLSNFQRDPDMVWLQQNIGHAKAVLISPRIFQAGFVIGGSGGNLLVIARDGSRWYGPAFYKIGSGSIGLQAGAEAAEMVGLVMTDKGMDSLLSTSFKLGGDVSIAAGPVGAGTGAPIPADMVVYTRAKGLYGGLNLNGTVISADDLGNRAFYGTPAKPVDILVKHTVTSERGAPLTGMVSR